MAFDLPRSPRSLRFTGEVRALGKEEGGAGALGRARPNAGPPSAERAAPMASQASPPVARVLPPPRLTTMRGQVDSEAEEEDTLCLDRDAMEIAQLPDARHAKNLPHDVKAGSNLPVPGFRSKQEVARQHREPAVIARQPASAGLPLALWLCAAMVAAVVSFHFAPQAREGLQQAVRALDSSR